MRDFGDDRGFIKLIFTLAIFAALVFVGMSFGRPYYRYLTLRSFANDTLEMDIDNVKVIREKVLADAAKLDIPLSEDNLEVTKDNHKRIRVKAKWTEIVDFWGYYRKQLNFSLDEEY